MNRASLQTMQRRNHQICSHSCQLRRQGFCRVGGRNWNFLLQEKVACVQSRIDLHGSNASDAFPLRDRPLYGRGASIFWQEGSVQVDVAERRKIKHPLWNDAAVAHHDDGIGLQIGELTAEVVIVLDFFRLRDSAALFARRAVSRGKRRVRGRVL